MSKFYRALKAILCIATVAVGFSFILSYFKSVVGVYSVEDFDGERHRLLRFDSVAFERAEKQLPLKLPEARKKCEEYISAHGKRVVITESYIVDRDYFFSVVNNPMRFVLQGYRVGGSTGEVYSQGYATTLPRY